RVRRHSHLTGDVAIEVARSPHLVDEEGELPTCIDERGGDERALSRDVAMIERARVLLEEDRDVQALVVVRALDARDLVDALKEKLFAVEPEMVRRRPDRHAAAERMDQGSFGAEGQLTCSRMNAVGADDELERLA